VYRALIVDDEPVVLRGLEKLIPWEEYGVEVGGRATTASKAMEQLSGSAPFDILITDVRMPGMSGLDLIGRARELQPRLCCIVISAHDEFEYARAAIRLGAENYLLKPISRQELSSTIERTVEKLERERSASTPREDQPAAFRENILTRWLSGTITQQELAERAGLAGLNPYALEYAVLAAAVLEHPGLEKPEAVSALQRALLPRLAEQGPSDCIVDSSGRLLILIQGSELSARTALVRAAVQEGLKRVHQERGIHAFASLGAVVRGAQRVEVSCRSALLLQGYRMFCPADSVVSADEVPSSAGPRAGWDFAEIEELIRDGREEQARAYLRGVLSWFRADDGPPLAERKAALTDLILHIVAPVRQAAGGPQGMPASLANLFVSMEEAQTEERLEAWLCSVLETAMSSVRSQSDGTTPIARHLMDYIREHYDQEISLKVFAAENHVNASYLGQLFKRETGMMFTEYLNRIRMRRSEEMIRTEGLRIGEIARRVGFAHVSYFNHAFRKAFGSSPLEYRRMAAGGPPQRPRSDR